VLADELADAPLGSTVTIQIPTGPASPQDGLQVPIGAIFDAGKGPGVWLIGGQPEKVSWRPVAIRQLGDDRAQVTGQLKPGDRVVALGAHLLREGQQVQVGVTTAAAAAQGVRP
jgi:multidrug efflux pump subunit AcrA (membrane-fusion protein)